MKISTMINALEQCKEVMGDCMVAIEIEELTRFMPIISIMGGARGEGKDKCVFIYAGIDEERARYVVKKRERVEGARTMELTDE